MFILRFADGTFLGQSAGWGQSAGRVTNRNAAAVVARDLETAERMAAANPGSTVEVF